MWQNFHTTMKVMKDIFLKLMFNTLKFLPERVKIKKVEKLVTNLQDKTEYVIHMKI